MYPVPSAEERLPFCSWAPSAGPGMPPSPSPILGFLPFVAQVQILTQTVPPLIGIKPPEFWRQCRLNFFCRNRRTLLSELAPSGRNQCRFAPLALPAYPKRRLDDTINIGPSSVLKQGNPDPKILHAFLS